MINDISKLVGNEYFANIILDTENNISVMQNYDENSLFVNNVVTTIDYLANNLVNISVNKE